MKERRKYKRYKATVDASYARTECYVTIISLTTTKNISLGGICVTLSSLIRKGNKLLIELKSAHNKRFAALAEVAWARSIDGNGHNMCGLKFLWLSSESLLTEWFAFAEEA